MPAWPFTDWRSLALCPVLATPFIAGRDPGAVAVGLGFDSSGIAAAPVFVNTLCDDDRSSRRPHWYLRRQCLD